MKKQSKAYEQYCWVKQENIIFEETLYHNGIKKTVCKNLAECRLCGGCRNHILKTLWENEKKQVAEVDN